MNHSRHREKEHQQREKMDNRISVSKEFQSQLINVFEKYLNLKDALVDNDATKALKYSVVLLTALAKVNMKLLTDKNTHNAWIIINKEIASSMTEISKVSDIEKQRNHFKHASAHFIKAIKLFGVNQQVYEQFRPVADDNKGTYWLSLNETINNPYLGSKMWKYGINYSITNLEIVCGKENVGEIINIIKINSQTGHSGDGLIYESNVDRKTRISEDN